VLRALWEFFSERVTFEAWTPATAGATGSSIAITVPIEVEPPAEPPEQPSTTELEGETPAEESGAQDEVE